MYSEEFENLLKEYLTDGIITTKERQVLLKKAQQLGYDVDEVDLYIDAQQQKCDQAVEAAAAKKRGKVCPRCGASIQSMQLTCPECGFEFNGQEANKTAAGLLEELSRIDKEKVRHDREHKGFWDDSYYDDDEKKTQIIATWPIPNKKEDLIEFIGICKANLEAIGKYDNEQLHKAWKGKSQQVIMKCKLMMKDDPEVLAYVDELDKKVNKKSFFAKLFGR